MFSGIHTSKVDSKGRISVPARFRAVLERDGMDYVYCHPPLPEDDALPQEGLLNAGGKQLLRAVQNTLERLDQLTEDYNDLAHVFYGLGEELPLDAQGRILLSERIRTQLKLNDAALFTGAGYMFRIWQPEIYKSYDAEARARARRSFNAQARSRKMNRALQESLQRSSP